jgi:hypothetical protein
MLASANPNVDKRSALLVTDNLEAKTTATTAPVSPVIDSNAATLDACEGSLFLFTVSANLTITVINGVRGQRVTVVITSSGTTNRTVTFEGTKSTGTLGTGTTDGKKFVVTFVNDGTEWLEESRTAAQ